MIFHPQNLIKKAGSLVFSGEINAVAHSCLNKDIIKDFWQRQDRKRKVPRSGKRPRLRLGAEVPRRCQRRHLAGHQGRA